MNVLSKINNTALLEYINFCSKYISIDVNKAVQLTTDSLKHRKSNIQDRVKLGHLQKLQLRWYNSLNKNKPDYSVYSDNYYITNLWGCWIVYSRKYILSIQKLNLKNINTIADLGCGFGYTSAALKQIFPNAKVVGTNLSNSAQFKIATEIGKQYNFIVVPRINGKKDLVFASEYFEHILDPIQHLEEIIKTCSPKHFIFANSFNTLSIGHFHKYLYRGNYIDAKYMSKIFTRTLKNLGYSKVITGFWNNRPSYYIKDI